MKTAARILRWLGAALGLLIAVVLVAFGLLQTQTGQAWLARTLERTLSTPDFTVAVAGLHGTVPFNLKVDRIDIGDRDGTYLTLRDFGLDISAAELLARRLHIRALSFAEVDMARSSTAPSSTTLLPTISRFHTSPWGSSSTSFPSAGSCLLLQCWAKVSSRPC